MKKEAIKEFINRYSILFQAHYNDSLSVDFLTIYKTPLQLMEVLRLSKLRENLYKKLLIYFKDRPLFYEALWEYYSYLKIRKERAKRLFLDLIKNDWVRNNVIFAKGPVLSYQQYGNLDERFYSDIDVIVSKAHLPYFLKLVRPTKIKRFVKLVYEAETEKYKSLIDITILEELPFKITPVSIYIDHKKLLCIDGITTSRVYLFEASLSVNIFGLILLKEMFLLNNSIIQSPDWLFPYSSFIKHIYFCILRNDYNDPILQDFFLLILNSKNKLKRYLTLIKFLKKYHIKINLSYYPILKEYPIKKILHFIITSL